MSEPDAALRDRRLLDTFVSLADTLVAHYDVVDLLQMLVETCHEVLGAAAAGILLADEKGELDLVASTSGSRLVEMMQLSADAGPCVEAFTSGRAVSVADIAKTPAAWRDFHDSATEQGFVSVYAIPMRLRNTTIGTLYLLGEERGELSDADLVVAQALADVATIGILQARASHESAVVREQPQSALNSRAVIEQAKGVVAQTRNIEVDAAFAVMRDYARSHRLGLSQVAARLVERSLTL